MLQNLILQFGKQLGKKARRDFLDKLTRRKRSGSDCQKTCPAESSEFVQEIPQRLQVSGNAGDHGTVHLHRAPRAEFLTAEAVDAAPAVDVRPAVFDRNGMGRTDIAAHAAADAQRPLQARPRPQRKRRRLPEQAAEGAAPRAEIRPRPMLL